MWIKLVTACGCVRYMEQNPKMYGRVIRVHLRPTMHWTELPQSIERSGYREFEYYKSIDDDTVEYREKY